MHRELFQKGTIHAGTPSMQMKLLTLTIFILLSGCNSNKPTNLDQSLQEYRNGQWLLSEMWAEKAIKSKEDVVQSQYMMGLC